MKLNKVAVAMSGGVDSSVTALLMCEKYGKESVIGVTAKLFCYSKESKNKKACCSLDAIEDARSVCEAIGIPHYIIDEERDFEELVIKNFIEVYRAGGTPIPCIPCNTDIKFGSMLNKVKQLGCNRLATGHYAQIKKMSLGTKDEEPKYQLLRGADLEKDQTYFLYGLNQQQLSQVEFPVGALSKKEVRKIAEKIGIKIAKKRDSQGVCFVTEGRVTDFLADKIKSKKGNIKDTSGKIIGNHDGHIFYTIGQRKGVGGGNKEPMFVVGIDVGRNEVIVGSRDELYKKELTFDSSNWINEVSFPLKCTAKIRYNMYDVECVIGAENQDSRCQEKLKLISTDVGLPSLKSRKYNVTFSIPQRAITPGQSVVFYDQEVCLGGGVITSSSHSCKL